MVSRRFTTSSLKPSLKARVVSKHSLLTRRNLKQNTAHLQKAGRVETVLSVYNDLMQGDFLCLFGPGALSKYVLSTSQVSITQKIHGH